MTKRMLIDGTHPEEIRVVVTSGNKLDEYDVETSTKKQLKGNIYLAKVTRVEPSLQAAFVDFGGNRHGFLAFNEIHPDYYQIPVADREALLAEHEEMERRAEAAQAHVDEIDGGLDDDDDETDNGDDEVSDAEITAVGDDDDTDEAIDDAPDDAEESDEAVSAVAESIGAPEADVAARPIDDGADPDDGDALPIDPADAEQPVIGEPVPAEPVVAESANGGERRRRRSTRRYNIQEVIKRRQILLVQVVKEERGNKGAALTTYISLAGRYCVLMPNTARGGGISRKITNATSRRKLRKILGELEIPDGMGVIMRTAGMERNKTEIKRDLDYLVRAWDEVRELTLQSSAPTLVYEEASLIKRAIRDLYAKEIEEVLVDGGDAYQTAKKFMRLLMPSHAKRVQPYRDGNIPLFFRYQVEDQLDAMHSPVVQLKSGGYIVIHSTEALVAIDVNSGRSTRERNIEETALKTNLEAAEEVARQFRLRDLAGLIVIDFIDMDETRNMRAVERKIRESMKGDRARIQIGRISGFGLLELSRQRLRPSLIETSGEACPHCQGTGFLRSTESMAVRVLRSIEEEGIRNRSSEVSVNVATAVAIYILNQKRAALVDIENRYGFTVDIVADDKVVGPEMRLERVRAKSAEAVKRHAISIEGVVEEGEAREAAAEAAAETAAETATETAAETATETAAENGEDGVKRRPRRRRSRKKPTAEETTVETAEATPAGDGDEDAPESDDAVEAAAGEDAGEDEGDGAVKRRRRGRRGGRRRSRRAEQAEGDTPEADAASETVSEAEPSAEEAAPATEPVSEIDTPDPVTEPAEEIEVPEPVAEPIAVAPSEIGVAAAPTFNFAAETTDPVETSPPANDTADDTNGEAIADAAEADDATGDYAAETAVAEIGPGSATEVPPEVAADRPKRKGWWQKLVE